MADQWNGGQSGPGERWNVNMPAVIGVVFVFLVGVIVWVIAASGRGDEGAIPGSSIPTVTSTTLPATSSIATTTPPPMPSTTVVPPTAPPTVPPTVRLSVQTFGADVGPAVFAWVFASHHVAAGLMAVGAGVARDALGTYAPAFLFAGLACLVAAASFSAVRNPAQKPAPA